MIILVGGNGFVGRHVAERLHRGGVPGVVVSRTSPQPFLDAHAPSLTALSAAEFAGPAGADLIARARAFVFLASQSVPSTFAEEPWRELPMNVQPAFALFLRVAALNPAAKLVLLSSGGTVYGAGAPLARDESAPLAPISGYGLGKVMIEDALRFVGRTRGLRHAILRLSNPVGRWQRGGAQGIVGAALRAARQGSALPLFGAGAQVRDFVDADDVAEAVVRACLDEAHPAATWNVGSGRGVSVLDLVGQVSEIIGQPIALAHLPDRGIDVPHIVLDCRRVAADLGWAATTPLEHSIRQLWDIVREPRAPNPASGEVVSTPRRALASSG